MFFVGSSGIIIYVMTTSQEEGAKECPHAVSPHESIEKEAETFLKDTSGKLDKSESEVAESKTQAARASEKIRPMEIEEQKTKSQKVTSLEKQLIGTAEELAEVQLELKKAGVENRNLVSEKSIIQKNLEAERKAVLRSKQLLDDAKAATRLADGEAQLLKKELDTMRTTENRLNREIMVLKRENAVATGKTQLSEDKVKKSGQELQNNAQIIASLENEVSESRCQVEASKKQYDAVRMEMNHVIKELTNAQREIKELEQGKESMKRLVDTLRSDISVKESTNEEHFESRREKTQKELYADEISRLKRSIVDSEETVQTHQNDIRHLGTTVRKLEDDAAGQRRECDQVKHERDILGSELIRRNDEVALLYEKIKILQSTKQRCEVQYNSRLDDIRILEIKVRDLQRQLTIYQGGQAGDENLTRNLQLVQNELVRERVKVKALSDELENPLNIHRWRKLEGTDPEAYEMLQKIQILQRRLLLKSEEVVKKNTIIQEQEKRQLEMEKSLARQPGPEMAEQLNSYQNEVRKKSKQVKAMAGELNMHHAQVDEYKREVESVTFELQTFKRKYFELRRREALAKEKELEFMSESTCSRPFRDQSNQPAARDRFVGGGFAIK